MNAPSTARRLAAVLLGVTSSIAGAQVDRSDLAPVPVDQLKTVYLQCDRLASRTLVDTATAAQCSMVAEELRERGFGGSFNLLLQWWQQARPADAVVPAANAAPGDGHSETKRRE